MCNPWHVTPYRVVVFATGEHTTGKGKRQRTKTIGYGFISWTATQFFDAGPRLPGAGSLMYAGFLRARQAAVSHLRTAGVHQVQVRTNQDRKVLIYNKHSDGRVTCYGDCEE